MTVRGQRLLCGQAQPILQIIRKPSANEKLSHLEAVKVTLVALSPKRATKVTPTIPMVIDSPAFRRNSA
jgi:hypothetical protein